MYTTPTVAAVQTIETMAPCWMEAALTSAAAHSCMPQVRSPLMQRHAEHQQPPSMQGAQYGLIKKYASNHIMGPYIIKAIFLT